MTTIVNLNNHAISPRVHTPEGTGFVHIQPKGKVTLAAGTTLDANWAATAERVRIIKPVEVVAATIAVTPTPVAAATPTE